MVKFSEFDKMIRISGKMDKSDSSFFIQEFLE